MTDDGKILPFTNTPTDNPIDIPMKKVSGQPTYSSQTYELPTLGSVVKAGAKFVGRKVVLPLLFTNVFAAPMTAAIVDPNVPVSNLFPNNTKKILDEIANYEHPIVTGVVNGVYCAALMPGMVTGAALRKGASSTYDGIADLFEGENNE